MLDPFKKAGEEITKPSFELSTDPMTKFGTNTRRNTEFDKTDFSRDAGTLEPESRTSKIFSYKEHWTPSIKNSNKYSYNLP